ncbi:EamA-like transporter family protein [Paracoccus alcaliphilus]|uniref:EamA-like transporter family protein n=1 Tax=Paracoccus alcaliphilus TaxID=34002 RepID=A0A1H8L076_9RHOB|nr:EamA family transporter [Paracoccus alcaliphilus]WCR17717.1 EamA family transporter [Paracoccus alcaliphilus]SEN98236.1 EamA-like transporter family protein [Paracoccus alcaliphilus]
MIWIAATLIAAAAQTFRNAAQSGLTRQIGTIGATSVRFVFGVPFALLALGLAALAFDIPRPGGTTLAWAALGAGAQIAATVFMLITMRGQSFGIATALMKTEPVTLAIIGAIVLAEPLGPARMGAIVLATAGVVLASGARWSRASARPVLTGIAAGALFGLSSIGFRGAILSLPDGGYVIRALTTLAITLGLQSAAMLAWMAIMDRPALRGIVGEWRVSLAAGALGAFASLFWFIGFALTAAANVRTLALIEVPLAQILSGRVFRETIGRAQLLGICMIVLGVGWLLAAA